jgi:F-type H+-transporting ATPase subunit gamma
MSGLKILRTRIKSVKATQKITSAMRMVAAAKLRRSQERVEAVRPYEHSMHEMLNHLLYHQQEVEEPLQLMRGHPHLPIHLLVVVTTDRGLCGGFNGAIVREAKLIIRQLQAQGKVVKIFCLGRKGRDLLRRDYGDLIIETVAHGELSAKGNLGDNGFGDALSFATKLQSLLENHQFGEASVLFNIFRSVLQQEVAHHSLIPFQVIPWEQGAMADSLYEYEPTSDALLVHLLPRYLAVNIYRVFLEHHASEQGARMTAMENATRNAKDMIKRLELTYNQTRQAYITKELIEIISGAEALR